MQKDALNNVHISAEQILIRPEELKVRFPLGSNDENNIAQARKTIADIVHGRDPRLLVVCGPCSIHDYNSTLEYASFLKECIDKYGDKLEIKETSISFIFIISALGLSFFRSLIT